MTSESCGSACGMIMDLSRSILGSAIVRDGEILELCRTDALPLPDQARLTRMMIQGVVIMAIPKSNEDYFGEFRLMMINHGFMDLILMPLKDRGAITFLCMLVKRPCSVENIIMKASAILEEFGLKWRDRNNDL
jgi:hypothetical protein